MQTYGFNFSVHLCFVLALRHKTKDVLSNICAIMVLHSKRAPSV